MRYDRSRVWQVRLDHDRLVGYKKASRRRKFVPSESSHMNRRLCVECRRSLVEYRRPIFRINSWVAANPYPPLRSRSQFRIGITFISGPLRILPTFCPSVSKAIRFSSE